MAALTFTYFFTYYVVTNTSNYSIAVLTCDNNLRSTVACCQFFWNEHLYEQVALLSQRGRACFVSVNSYLLQYNTSSAVLRLQIYQCVQLNYVLLSLAYPSTDKNDVELCCHKQVHWCMAIVVSVCCDKLYPTIETVDYITRCSHRSESQVLVENRDFCSIYEGRRRNITITFSMDKLEWYGYRWFVKFENMFTRFDRIHERDGQRRHRALCIASRGKNVPKLLATDLCLRRFPRFLSLSGEERTR